MRGMGGSSMKKIRSNMGMTMQKACLFHAGNPRFYGVIRPLKKKLACRPDF
jgi:hypothetical protein